MPWPPQHQEYKHLVSAINIRPSSLLGAKPISSACRCLSWQKLAGVARNTLSAKTGARKVDAALSPIVRILAMAEDMAGGEQRAAIWFRHQPIPGWAGKPHVISSGKGNPPKYWPKWRPHAQASMPEQKLATQILWRAFVPRWAHAPLSGEGAAQFGGRWNPVGTATIHAARELSTAWAEYNQGFVQHPALIAQLRLENADLVDLTQSTVLQDLGVPASIHQGEWRADLDEGRQPDAHRLRERLLTGGTHGVIYPSFMSPGGTCVALWHWNDGNDAPLLSVIDPYSRLPRTAASWM